MKQITSNDFRIYGGELYVTDDGFRRIFVDANKDILRAESESFANVILEHFQDGHDDEMMTFDETDYVNVYTIMNHVDVELDKHSLMFARAFVKLFDDLGDELLDLENPEYWSYDLENPENWPYLLPSLAQSYLEILRILGTYLQIAEIWWKLQLQQ